MLRNFMAKPGAAQSNFVCSPSLRAVRLLGIGLLTGLLAACAQSPKTMYNWQAYQSEVYNYLKEDGGSDYAAQAQLLEQNIDLARSANQALPPGFHAHLGMLYLKLGKNSQAIEQIQSEKLAFPEATPFMEFLLRNVGASDTQDKKLSTTPDSVVAGQTTSTTIAPPTTQEPKKGA